MRIESRFKDGFQILSLQDDVGYKTDLSGFEAAVQEYLDKGIVNIALRFTKDSYLSSRPLTALVSLARKIRDRGGVFAFVEPNDAILDCLQLLSLDTQVKVFSCEDDVRG